jgi:uroporphyrin-III C-methyltransferase
MSGIVYLVGAGPGAPDLLTLRAARILAEADVVFHDALVHPATVALAVRAEKVAVGKRCARQATAQKFINKRLIDAARRHAIVVRLKGGDPMLFGRAQEEIAALEGAEIRYEVVPGVTAALAASAELSTSLTQRGVARSVAFATPRVGEGEDPSEWARSIAAADTGAIYMGAGQAEQLASALLAAGKSPAIPVAVVENASLAEVRTIFTTLGALPKLAEQQVVGPAVILIGPQFRQRDTAGRLSDAAPEGVRAARLASA